MNAVVERSEHSQVTLKVEVEPERLAKATQQAYQRLVGRVNVPGFRRGKAPRHILERMLGPDALYREALDFVMPSAYREAVLENKIVPYADPEFEVVQLQADMPLIFKAVVPVEPTVELGDYQSIKIEPEAVSVTDDEVEQALKQLQQSNGQLVPVEDRPVAVGDQVHLDLVSSTEGRVISGAKPQDTLAELDNEAPYPSWANSLAGMQVGDQKTISDEIPADYRDSSIAGKTVTHQVTVKAIKQKELPAIDDELARTVGEYADLNALKADVLKRLETQKRSRARAKFEEAAVNKLVEVSKIEFPDIMIEEKLDQMLRDLDRNFHRQGFGLEAYLRASGKPFADFRNDMRPEAIDRVKWGLALRALATKEALTASDDEVTAEIENLVENSTPDRRDEIRKAGEAPGIRESLRNTIVGRKALERLDRLVGGEEFLIEESIAEARPGVEETVLEEPDAVVGGDTLASGETPVNGEPQVSGETPLE